MRIGHRLYRGADRTALRPNRIRGQSISRQATLYYVGIEPKVNRVCLCFPFFLLLTDDGSSADCVCSTAAVVPPEAGTPLQALGAGAPVPPKIFINDILPLTGTFALAADEGVIPGTERWIR